MKIRDLPSITQLIRILAQTACLLNYTLHLFNLYAENIMRNAGLDEAQGGIKIARRNINNLRYTDDTTLDSRK